MWLYAFALVWTAVASSAITTIVLKRRGHGLQVGEVTSPYPIPAWVPPADSLGRPEDGSSQRRFAPLADELRRHHGVPMPAAASAVTIRFLVPEESSVESWERDETTPHRLPSASSRLPTVPA